MPYAAVNGLNMYYEDQGNGPPLVLLHGGMGSVPEKWAPFFIPSFRVITPDQMGQGRTADIADRPFHYHEMAEDTVELMRQLGVESAHVVGYSDGGIVGLDMAVNHPQRVAKLVVSGANARVDGYTQDNQEFLRSFDPAAEPVWDDYVQRSPDGAEHWPVVLARMKLMWTNEPSFTNDELRTITAPTLLIIGDDDIVTPEHAAEMSATIPDAQLCLVPDAGHGTMPGEEIMRFLRESVT